MRYYLIALFAVSLLLGRVDICMSKTDNQENVQLGYEILKKMNAMDDLYSSESTLTGTVYDIPTLSPDVPSQKMKYKMSMKNNQCAIVKETLEVFDRRSESPKYGQEDSIPTMLMKGAIYFGPNRTGQNYVFGRALSAGEKPNYEKDRLHGQVLLQTAESEYLTVTRSRMFWAIGRGYAKSIQEVLKVDKKENGTILIEANGYSYPRVPGKWVLEVNPDAAFMVQNARFYHVSKGDNLDKPDIEITSNGVKWYDSLCVPEKINFSEYSGEVSYPVTVDSLTDKADMEFINETNNFLDPPYEVNTNSHNLGCKPPLVQSIKKGELFENDGGVSLGALDSKIVNRDVEITDDGGVKPPKISGEVEQNKNNDKEISDNNRHVSSSLEGKQGKRWILNNKMMAIILFIVSAVLLIVLLKRRKES